MEDYRLKRIAHVMLVTQYEHLSDLLDGYKWAELTAGHLADILVYTAEIRKAARVMRGTASHAEIDEVIVQEDIYMDDLVPEIVADLERAYPEDAATRLAGYREKLKYGLTIDDLVSICKEIIETEGK